MKLIHCKDSNGNLTYCKDLLYNNEVWQEYDSNGNLRISSTKQLKKANWDADDRTSAEPFFSTKVSFA